jgi:hypothetical protein
MCKITIAHGTSCAIFIQNMPLNLKIKSLFIIFKQRIHALNIIYARGNRKTLFQPMRHVQDFFKKNPPVENHVQKITVAHGLQYIIQKPALLDI